MEKKRSSSSNNNDDSKKDWVSLEQWLFGLFDHGNLRDPKILAAVSVYGKKRVREAYEKWKKLRDEEEESGS